MDPPLASKKGSSHKGRNHEQFGKSAFIVPNVTPSLTNYQHQTIGVEQPVVMTTFFIREQIYMGIHDIMYQGQGVPLKSMKSVQQAPAYPTMAEAQQVPLH